MLCQLLLLVFFEQSALLQIMLGLLECLFRFLEEVFTLHMLSFVSQTGSGGHFNPVYKGCGLGLEI